MRTALENLSGEMKKQKIVLEKQQTEVTTLESKLEQKSKEIESIRASSVPIGFLYTQLPNQMAPQEMFPNTNWTDITKDYAGLFFRAEGPDSAAFGQIQPANQSVISDVYFEGYHGDSWKGGQSKNYSSSLNQTKWIDMNPDISNTTNPLALVHLKFFTTGGEVRPKNTAIKIWKRIQ